MRGEEKIGEKFKEIGNREQEGIGKMTVSYHQHA